EGSQRPSFSRGSAGTDRAIATTHARRSASRVPLVEEQTDLSTALARDQRLEDRSRFAQGLEPGRFEDQGESGGIAGERVDRLQLGDELPAEQGKHAAQ